ncbi:MAG: dTDP-4-dehydrorhamnose reductase [Elusimicrobiota bacterium]|nr:dTDP-4-dehydrorhamnose reductase [Elusimicrobiota bacterium]
MKYLIAGANGQLASEFISQFGRAGTAFLAPSEQEFDITSPVSIKAVVEAYRPDVILNCAAYNLVDKAQTESAKAFLVNAEGPRNLAMAARQAGAKFVHYSSDYVFSGTKTTGAYLETDPTGPVNIYGESKLQGEKLVLAEYPQALILRLSWVYGCGSQNFIYKLQQWSKNPGSLKIADDEISVPTSTERVADLTLKAIVCGITGLYHGVSSGYCSRFEWAKAILNIVGIEKELEPAKTESFNLPAKRPAFSAMGNHCLADALGVDIPGWKKDLEGFILQKTGICHES